MTESSPRESASEPRCCSCSVSSPAFCPELAVSSCDVETPARQHGLWSAVKSCCVYCGSSPGSSPVYRRAAALLGRELASRGVRLVYGGAEVGLMGEVANAVLAGGGEVVGVIPRALAEKEVMHHGLTELLIVESMHERKSKMAELAEAFVALPGGIGTLEELLETLTWAQLGVHEWPCGLLDVGGYYAPLLAMLDRAVEERFLRVEQRGLLMVETDPAVLLDRFADHVPLHVTKWLDREAT